MLQPDGTATPVRRRLYLVRVVSFQQPVSRCKTLRKRDWWEDVDYARHWNIGYSGNSI